MTASFSQTFIKKLPYGVYSIPMKQSDRIGQQEIAFVRDRLWDSKNRLHREGALPLEEAMPFGMGARCAQIPMESASTAIVASAAVIRADSAAAVAAASQKQQNPDQGITAVVAAVVTATAVVCSESVVAAA